MTLLRLYLLFAAMLVTLALPWPSWFNACAREFFARVDL